MKRYILAAAAAILALAACNRENAVPENASSEIRFTSNIVNTFAVKGLDPLADGKTVRILAGAPVNGNTDATVSGTALTPATPLHWADKQTVNTTFVGLYPSNGETETTIHEFAVAAAGVQDFEYMNNFLAAVVSAAPGTTVNLPFKHPLVKVVVDVDNQLTGTPEVTAVTFKSVLVKGDLDIAAGTVANTVGGDVNATKNATSGKFEAIILPQASAKPVLVLAVGTKTYTFKIGTAVNFEAGKSYTATLTLKDSTPPVVQGEEVGFGFTVTDWDEVATAISATDITEQWSAIGTINDGAWDNDIVLVEGTTPGILEATITYKAGNEFKLRKAEDWTVSAGLKAGVAYVGDSSWDGFLDQTDNNIKLEAAGEYKITFNPETWAFTATKTGDVAADPNMGKLILNVYNGAGWGTMYMYGWADTPYATYTAAWPGDAPRATDVVVSGVSYKCFEIENVPLNNATLKYILNNGSSQTADLDIPVVLTAAETTVYVQLKSDLSVEVIDDPTSFTPVANP